MILKVLIPILTLTLLGVGPVFSPIAQRDFSPAIAQGTPVSEVAPTDALTRLFTATPVEATWFAEPFLTQLPLAQIEQILQDITLNLGTFQRVEAGGDNYQIVFDRGTLPAQIQLNSAGQISALWFFPPQLNHVSLPEVVAEFERLPGQVQLLVLHSQHHPDGQERESGEVLAAINPDVPMAVGSAFKLVVLQALHDDIAAGRYRWDQVIPLDPTWQSLPSGILQTWPAETPLTLQTLATLMISISDNTATDALIDVVGTDALEALSPRNRPFLTTRAAFTLKNPDNQELLERYLQGDEAERRSLLTTILDYPLPGVGVFADQPLAPEIEWFFTGAELCDAIAAVADLAPMRAEPGVVINPDAWAQVAFKGGSEPGVLNLTTHLTTVEGDTYCVVATWNRDTAVDELQFATLYQSLLGTLPNP